MTQSMAVQDLQENEAVEELDGDETHVHFLAAIQHGYEEAKASIDGLPRSSWPTTTDGTEPHPGTEKIDLRLVGLPAVPAAPTPPTAAMSLAARVAAEQPVSASARHEPAGAGHDSPRRSGRVAAVISRWFPGAAAFAPTATACDA